jgi:hypothetical protein
VIPSEEFDEGGQQTEYTAVEDRDRLALPGSREPLADRGRVRVELALADVPVNVGEKPDHCASEGAGESRSQG